MNKGAGSSAPPTPPRLVWRDKGWSVTLEIKSGVIAAAHVISTDAGADEGFLTALNKAIVGMGLREARDHGVQYAIAAQAGGKPAVSGIVIPANYSPTSRGAALALRAAIDQTVPPSAKDWNFEDHGLSHGWRAIAKDVRSQRLEGLIKEFLQKAGLPEAAVITDIDQYDRVFLQFQDDFPIAQKPPILMQLERHVRQATGERIELFMAEMKDNNRIRRL